MTTEARIRCVFCRTTTGARTGEHILRRWFEGKIPSGYDGLAVHRRSNRGEEFFEIPQSPFNQKVNDVCADCNNGWLNDLENDVGGLIVELANGQWRGLTGHECRSLSVWCVTRGLMRSLQDGRTGMRAAPELFHNVYLTRRPPRGARVHIALTEGNVRAGGSNTAFEIGDSDGTRHPGRTVNIVSYGIGLLFFQVGIPGDSAEARGEVARLLAVALDHGLDALIPIWPIEPTMPQPRRLLTKREAREVSNLLALTGFRDYAPGELTDEG